jgi:hypothetical protein
MNNLLRQTKTTATALALLFACQTMLTAQEKNTAPAAKPAQSARAAQPAPKAQPAKAPQEQAPPADQFTTDNKMTTKIFTIQYRDPRVLVGILKGFQSRDPDVRMDPNVGLRDKMVLTVRDFPANLELIEKALENLDVPEEKARTFELTISLLWASKKDVKGDPVPSSLSDVVNSISSTMSYKFFAEVGTIKCLLADDREHLGGNGSLTIPGLQGSWPLEWGLGFPKMGDDGALYGKFKFSVHRLKIDGANVNLYEGQQTVIGTAIVDDSAIIIVLSIESK